MQIEKMAKEYPTTKFVKLDVDEHSESGAEFKIRGVPTFIFFKGDKIHSQVSVL